MREVKRLFHVALIIAFVSGTALAKLPDPTPAQAEAAAAKKAQADAQAEKDKKALAASMETIAARWRQKAAANDWPAHPPTPVAATQGLSAPATQSSASGQPDGRQGSAALKAPKRSEKEGTAAPSADVKTGVPSIK